RGFNVCPSGRTVVITRIDENHVTYSAFTPGTEELSAYATLLKVDEDKFETAQRIRVENNACENLYLDLEKGTLNGLPMNASQKDVRSALPCFTGDSPDGAEYNCGGGVFYLNHDFYFYSGQDYIEVRKNFRGELSQSILDKTTAEIEALLGFPERSEEVKKWDGTQRIHYFYPRKYGCLSLVFINRKVHKVALHSTSIQETQLCY
ncbi:MAG: hypothetical protein HC880_08155, partial [Bacteroidia bacterium]|nr:hypothetical protein [Bacteroidia bacterium]